MHKQHKVPGTIVFLSRVWAAFEAWLRDFEAWLGGKGGVVIY